MGVCRDLAYKVVFFAKGLLDYRPGVGVGDAVLGGCAKGVGEEGAEVVARRCGCGALVEQVGDCVRPGGVCSRLEAQRTGGAMLGLVRE